MKASLLADISEGARVGLDTSVFIYFIEDHPQYAPIVAPFFQERLAKGANVGVTSAVTLAEVLTRPLECGQPELAARYRSFLTAAPGIVLAEITVSIAERAASLRARFGIRLPDALQISAALENHAVLFLCNDKRLRRVSDLKVLVLDDYWKADEA